ncbi:hypothetical protein ACLOJK_009457 [Asimina triloba]
MADWKNEGNDLISLELIETVEDGKSRRLSELVNPINDFVDLARFDVFGPVLNLLADDVNASLIQSIELQDHVLVMGIVQLPSIDQNGGSLADAG